MGEPEAVADDLDDAVLDRRTQATVDLARGSVAAAIASSVGADRAETTSSASTVSRGKPLEAVLDELLKPLGDRGPFAGRHLTSTAKERASDLLGEEGIAA